MDDFTTLPPDGGMPYAETNLNHLFPEPLNTLTSVLFLLLAIWWSFRIRKEFREHGFLTYALFLLYIGGIGGTIYHGLRQWRFFIMMDWLPIMLLCLSAGIWFIAKLTRWYYAALLVWLYIGFQFFARQKLIQSGEIQLFININYAVLASFVLFPVLGFLIRTKFANGKFVGFALLAFSAALFFRVADRWEILSFGTHFLWHIFGAVAAFCMLQFVYLTAGKKRNPSDEIPEY